MVGDDIADDISNRLTDGATNVIPDSWKTFATFAGGKKSVFIGTLAILVGGSKTVLT